MNLLPGVSRPPLIGAGAGTALASTFGGMRTGDLTTTMTGSIMGVSSKQSAFGNSTAGQALGNEVNAPLMFTATQHVDTKGNPIERILEGDFVFSCTPSKKTFAVGSAGASYQKATAPYYNSSFLSMQAVNLILRKNPAVWSSRHKIEAAFRPKGFVLKQPFGKDVEFAETNEFKFTVVTRGQHPGALHQWYRHKPIYAGDGLLLDLVAVPIDPIDEFGHKTVGVKRSSAGLNASTAVGPTPSASASATAAPAAATTTPLSSTPGSKRLKSNNGSTIVLDGTIMDAIVATRKPVPPTALVKLNAASNAKFYWQYVPVVDSMRGEKPKLPMDIANGWTGRRYVIGRVYEVTLPTRLGTDPTYAHPTDFEWSKRVDNVGKISVLVNSP